MKQVEFIYVDGLNSNSNKFYRMIDTEDGNFRVEYGRIGLTLITETYPIGKWDSKYKEKVRKGYKDVTDLKIESSGGSFQFSSTDVEHFYGVFSRYTANNVKRNYTIAVGSVTKAMIDEAQQILNSLTQYPKLDVFNKHLLELYTVLPRKMKNVKDFLPSVEDQTQLQKLIAKEQDVLDSLSSSVVTNVTSANEKFEDSLGIEINLLTDPNELKKIEDLINTTNNTRYRIYKIFQINNKVQDSNYSEWKNVQNNQTEELLIHGTRNANCFSILKQGLKIRPTNAAMISGNIYGTGTYFSNAVAKSLNYTGGDADKLIFLNTVLTGNKALYHGWYREGKGLSNSQMNYDYLKSQGFDSLWVKAGDGLLRDEYILYKESQYKHSFLVWLK